MRGSQWSIGNIID